VLEVFKEYNLDAVTFSEPKLNTQNNPMLFFGSESGLRITARTPKLYQAYLQDNPPAVVEGTVPVVIDQNTLLSLADISFKDGDNASYRIAKIRDAAKTWSGKVVTVTQAETPERPKTTTKMTIQGFFSSGGLLDTGEYASLIIPDDTLGALVAGPLQKSSISYFAAFPNQEAQVKYASELSQPPKDFNQKFYRYGSVYGSPLLAFKEIKQTAKSVLTYVVIALLIAVGIAMLTTLAKIISDSERESGVFRAIGAKSQDILQIYLTYSIFISLVAMVVALVVAASLSGYLTNRYAPDLTAQLISLSGSSNIAASISLIGVNPLHLLGVFVAILVAGILGTLIPLSKLLREDPIKALRAD
jgi:ABC-type antimicrobial peptide transport system permease subunit